MRGSSKRTDHNSLVVSLLKYLEDKHLCGLNAVEWSDKGIKTGIKHSKRSTTVSHHVHRFVTHQKKWRKERKEKQIVTEDPV